MEYLVLAVVVGIPLILALYAIDTLSSQGPRWHTEEQLRAATGAFFDHPAGHRASTRHAAEPEAELAPVARRPVASPVGFPGGATTEPAGGVTR